MYFDRSSLYEDMSCEMLVYMCVLEMVNTPLSVNVMVQGCGQHTAASLICFQGLSVTIWPRMFPLKVHRVAER